MLGHRVQDVLTVRFNFTPCITEDFTRCVWYPVKRESGTNSKAAQEILCNMTLSAFADERR